MTVGVVGLGLIGGSFAKAYSKAGHTVLGADIDKSNLKYAILSGAVSGELKNKLLGECDLILLCTYPGAAIKYMEKNGALMGEKPIVIDCCGTKRAVVQAGMKLAEKFGFKYAGGHPMAGNQYSGFKYSKDTMFHDAPMVIIPPRYDDIAFLDKIKDLLKPAGFSQITVTTAEKHDEIIAYTSQLAHIVSSAYIKSPASREHKGISAGSYKDMTRVALLNPVMWAELFLDNRDNLIKEIDVLLSNLTEYRNVLEKRDKDNLIQMLEKGRQMKEEAD